MGDIIRTRISTTIIPIRIRMLSRMIIISIITSLILSTSRGSHLKHVRNHKDSTMAEDNSVSSRLQLFLRMHLATRFRLLWRARLRWGALQQTLAMYSMDN